MRFSREWNNLADGRSKMLDVVRLLFSFDSSNLLLWTRPEVP